MRLAVSEKRQQSSFMRVHFQIVTLEKIHKGFLPDLSLWCYGKPPTQLHVNAQILCQFWNGTPPEVYAYVTTNDT